MSIQARGRRRIEEQTAISRRSVEVEKKTIAFEHHETFVTELLGRSKYMPLAVENGRASDPRSVPKFSIAPKIGRAAGAGAVSKNDFF